MIVLRPCSEDSGHAHILLALAILALALGLLVAVAAAGPAAGAAELISYSLAGLGLVALLSLLLGALVVFWPLRLPVGWRRASLVNPEALQTPQARSLFEQALAYHDGLLQMAAAAEDRQLRRLLGRIGRDTEAPIRSLFELARQVEIYRQDRILESDLVRLRAKAASGPLAAAEREQLESLNRLETVAASGERLMGDMVAILGRLYAQGREVTMVRDVQGALASEAVDELREQAVELEHLREALRQVYLLPDDRQMAGEAGSADDAGARPK